MSSNNKDQYLRNLQSRAQQLLQISSQDDYMQDIYEERHGGKSRRVDLQQVLSNADIHSRDEQQFNQIRKTDVQLLKRCIALTTENSSLKQRLSHTQQELLKTVKDNKMLIKQIDRLNNNLKSRSSDKQGHVQTYQSPYRQIQEFYQDGGTKYKNQPQQQQQSNYLLKSSKQSSSKQNNTNHFNLIVSQLQQQLKRQKAQHRNQIDNLRSNYDRKIGEFQQRIKSCAAKSQQFQSILNKEKQKSHKLSKFISIELPKLKDVITALTAKVQCKVESILTRDLRNGNFSSRNNQNYMYNSNSKIHHYGYT